VLPIASIQSLGLDDVNQLVSSLLTLQYTPENLPRHSQRKLSLLLEAHIFDRIPNASNPSDRIRMMSAGVNHSR
jgi:hypothetical protein